jgi:hypothetical protein
VRTSSAVIAPRLVDDGVDRAVELCEQLCTLAHLVEARFLDHARLHVPSTLAAQDVLEGFAFYSGRLRVAVVDASPRGRLLELVRALDEEAARLEIVLSMESSPLVSVLDECVTAIELWSRLKQALGVKLPPPPWRLVPARGA